MNIVEFFDKMVYNYPDLFYMNAGRLALKNCRWVIALPYGNDALEIHDLREITTESFYFDRINGDIVLTYGCWKNRYCSDEVLAEQIILASAAHYNEMYQQTAKERYNTQVEQALNNLD